MEADFPTPADTAEDLSVRERASARAETLAEFLREETTGGKILLAAAAAALVWANVAEGSYDDFWHLHLNLGPEWMKLDLSLAHWAADGLLAIFFFVAGMELKRELLDGELSNRRAATLPIFAAVGGMIVPAAIAIAASGGAAGSDGAWAIPTATDIAFALGVLAVAGASMPAGARAMLLSIAVVDDLLAIALIAVLFTSGFSAVWLGAAVAGCALYRLAFAFRFDLPAVLVAIGVVVWICVHASGIHATVAGIALGLLTPARPRAGERHSPVERLEHRVHPIAAGIAVPIFALAAAGIPFGALSGAASEPIAIGIVCGLVIGKTVGVLGGGALAARLGVGALPDGIGWADAAPLAALCGIGFTVSLLISELALGETDLQERVAGSILISSVLAGAVGVLLLRIRSRAHEGMSQ